MRDRPLIRDYFCSNLALHFYTFVPLIKDHLSYKTTFCGPMGWSLITGFTVVKIFCVHTAINLKPDHCPNAIKRPYCLSVEVIELAPITNLKLQIDCG